MKSIEFFFDIFLKELEQNSKLRQYHRIINSKASYLFRRSYYQQRLEYLINNIKKKDTNILDVGCGYGTTSILLGLLGHKVIGTTLEYYFEEIENRLKYWGNHFDTSNIQIKYENLFNSNYNDGEFDYIITQDTLHHLEPIDDAIRIFHRILNDSGQILVSEENGNNFVCRIKHFKERGFKRIIEVYDERLNEKILIGNENTRSMSAWEKIFSSNNFQIEFDNTEYIRFFPPFYIKKHGMPKTILKERELSKKSNLLQEYFFFGMNFTASKV